MRGANSDFASLSVLNTTYNHCLPPASSGNGQLRIWCIHSYSYAVSYFKLKKRNPKRNWELKGKLNNDYRYTTVKECSLLLSASILKDKIDPFVSGSYSLNSILKVYLLFECCFVSFCLFLCLLVLLL